MRNRCRNPNPTLRTAASSRPSTYDSATGAVHHYRDGDRIASGTFHGNIPVVHGNHTFGNRDHGARYVDTGKTTDHYRNFNGRLDEIAVIARAMTDGVLLRIYQAGRP